MSDPLGRLLLVVVVVAVAAGLGMLAKRKLATHQPVDIGGVGFEPGLVVFTSTACHRCKEVLAAAKATGVPLREVTYELEADLQERVGVTGVPLTLVIDGSGRLDRRFAGPVGRHRLQRALRRAGLDVA
jgi:glutaredoxin